MTRFRRFASLASVCALAATACGARVVPLSQSFPGDPVATTPTEGPNARPSPGGTFVPGRFVPGTGPGGDGGAPPLVKSDPACKGAGNLAEGVTKSSIKVGILAGLTGPLPGAFNASVEATDAYLKQVNAEGGVCGRKFDIVIKDDGQNAERNKGEALKLARNEKIFAFVGGISNADKGLGQVSAEFKIPDIGFPLDWTRARNKYTFGVPGQLQPDWVGEGASGTRYLNKTNGIKRVAMFWVTDAEVSILSAWSFEAAQLLADPNLEICFEQPTTVFDNGFGNYVVNMQSRCAPNPGDEDEVAVYTTMENNNNIKLAEAMELQGFRPKVFAPTFTSYSASFARPANAPRATEGAYMAMPQIPFERAGGHPEMNRYLAALKRWYPRHASPGSFGAPGWGMGALFVDAVAACGATLTRACVLDHLNGAGPFSTNGFLTATKPSDHQIYTCDLIVRVQNGKFVEIPRPAGKRGPPQSPDFWNCSELFNWQQWFCANDHRFPDPSGKKKRIEAC